MTMDPRVPWAGQLTSCIGPCAARTIWLWGFDQATIEGLRAMIRAGGVQQLAVGDLSAGIARQHKRQKAFRARQAAGVRRQDPPCSWLHETPPLATDLRGSAKRSRPHPMHDKT